MKTSSGLKAAPASCRRFISFTMPMIRSGRPKTGTIMVNVTFDIADTYRMQVHAGIIDIDYRVAFGEIKGYLRGMDGRKYILDNMMGMGEDKTLRF